MNEPAAPRPPWPQWQDEHAHSGSGAGIAATVTASRRDADETVTVAARASWQVRSKNGDSLMLRSRQTYCIGRQPGCGLVVDDPTVSRRHVEPDVLVTGVSVRADARLKNRPVVGTSEVLSNESVLVTVSPTRLVLGEVEM